MAGAGPRDEYVIRVFDRNDGYYVDDFAETTTKQHATRFTLDQAIEVQNEFADQTGESVEIESVE